MKILKQLLICSKTNTLSSMRLIALVGSVSMIICIMFLVFSKDERLVESIVYFIAALITFTTGKVVQSKFE